MKRFCASLLLVVCQFLTIGGRVSAGPKIDPCQRQAFVSTCTNPDGTTTRSQFVLRYYKREYECVSYPYGHCRKNPEEPELYKYKDECEKYCIVTPSSVNTGPLTSDGNATLAPATTAESSTSDVPGVTSSSPSRSLQPVWQRPSSSTIDLGTTAAAGIVTVDQRVQATLSAASGTAISQSGITPGVAVVTPSSVAAAAGQALSVQHPESVPQTTSTKAASIGTSNTPDIFDVTDSDSDTENATASAPDDIATATVIGDLSLLTSTVVPAAVISVGAGIVTPHPFPPLSASSGVPALAPHVPAAPSISRVPDSVPGNQAASAVARKENLDSGSSFLDLLPTPASKCLQQRQSALARQSGTSSSNATSSPLSVTISGGFVPKCTSSGSFEQIQCDSASSSCWCVDVDEGIELPGTRTPTARGQPDCLTGLMLYGSPALEAPSYARDQSTKPGTCPAPRVGELGVCVRECRRDNDCPGYSKCCYNGCGRLCLFPHDGTNTKPSTGASSDTTSTTKPPPQCDGAAESGPCNPTSPLVRWYYNPAKRICQTFNYGGCGGNGNNYETKKECEIHCAPQDTPLCGPGADPLEDKQGLLFNCLNQTCPPGWKCTYTTDKAVCCPDDGKSKNAGSLTNDICRLPKDRGNCDKYELRFYYNAEVNECKYFFFGGCGGNENNFKELAECQRVCGKQSPTPPDSQPPLSGPPSNSTASAARAGSSTTSVFENNDVPEALSSPLPPASRGSPTIAAAPAANLNLQTEAQPPAVRPPGGQPSQPQLLPPDQVSGGPILSPGDRCSHPKDSGPCSGRFIRWFWDPAKKSCEVFTYSGCQGNGNNFGSREECLSACRELPADVCQHPRDRGECPATFHRFFYDILDDTCKEFSYGGCGGNGNNFGSFSDCEIKCKKDKSTIFCPKVECAQECVLITRNTGCQECACPDYGDDEGPRKMSSTGEKEAFEPSDFIDPTHTGITDVVTSTVLFTANTGRIDHSNLATAAPAPTLNTGLTSNNSTPRLLTSAAGTRLPDIDTRQPCPPVLCPLSCHFVPDMTTHCLTCNCSASGLPQVDTFATFPSRLSTVPNSTLNRLLTIHPSADRVTTRDPVTNGTLCPIVSASCPTPCLVPLGPNGCRTCACSSTAASPANVHAGQNGAKNRTSTSGKLPILTSDGEALPTPVAFFEFGTDTERPDGCPATIKCLPECQIAPGSKTECERCDCPAAGTIPAVPADQVCPRVFCRQPDCITITSPETGCQECACVAPGEARKHGDRPDIVTPVSTLLSGRPNNGGTVGLGTTAALFPSTAPIAQNFSPDLRAPPTVSGSSASNQQSTASTLGHFETSGRVIAVAALFPGISPNPPPVVVTASPALTSPVGQFTNRQSTEHTAAGLFPAALPPAASTRPAQSPDVIDTGSGQPAQPVANLVPASPASGLIPIPLPGEGDDNTVSEPRISVSPKLVSETTLPQAAQPVFNLPAAAPAPGLVPIPLPGEELNDAAYPASSAAPKYPAAIPGPPGEAYTPAARPGSPPSARPPLSGIPSVGPIAVTPYPGGSPPAATPQSPARPPLSSTQPLAAASPAGAATPSYPSASQIPSTPATDRAAQYQVTTPQSGGAPPSARPLPPAIPPPPPSVSSPAAPASAARPPPAAATAPPPPPASGGSPPSAVPQPPAPPPAVPAPAAPGSYPAQGPGAGSAATCPEVTPCAAGCQLTDNEVGCPECECPPLPLNVCVHPKDTGDCAGAYPRAWYDISDNTCKQFQYTGCKGNGNNFATIAECEARCIGKLPPAPSEKSASATPAGPPLSAMPHPPPFTATQPPATVPGSPQTPEPQTGPTSASGAPQPPAGAPGAPQPPAGSEGEDASSGGVPTVCPSLRCGSECFPITNQRGCLECLCPGNGRHRLPSELPAVTLPPVAKTPFIPVASRKSVFRQQQPAPGSDSAAVTNPIPTSSAAPAAPAGAGSPPAATPPSAGSEDDKCSQPMDPGPCNGPMDKRWWFNSESGQCEGFMYGGCAGNRNHFYSLKECEIHCARFAKAKGIAGAVGVQPAAAPGPSALNTGGSATAPGTPRVPHPPSITPPTPHAPSATPAGPPLPPGGAVGAPLPPGEAGAAPSATPQAPAAPPLAPPPSQPPSYPPPSSQNPPTPPQAPSIPQPPSEGNPPSATPLAPAAPAPQPPAPPAAPSPPAENSPPGGGPPQPPGSVLGAGPQSQIGQPPSSAGQPPSSGVPQQPSGGLVPTAGPPQPPGGGAAASPLPPGQQGPLTNRHPLPVLKPASQAASAQQLQQLTSQCTLLRDTGPCYAYLPRWYHDSGACRAFIYGGCGGNANNFLTKDHCDRTCSGRPPQPPAQQSGTGGGYSPSPSGAYGHSGGYGQPGSYDSQTSDSGSYGGGYGSQSDGYSGYGGQSGGYGSTDGGQQSGSYGGGYNGGYSGQDGGGYGQSGGYEQSSNGYGGQESYGGQTGGYGDGGGYGQQYQASAPACPNGQSAASYQDGRPVQCLPGSDDGYQGGGYGGGGQSYGGGGDGGSSGGYGSSPSGGYGGDSGGYKARRKVRQTRLSSYSEPDTDSSGTLVAPPLEAPGQLLQQKPYCNFPKDIGPCKGSHLRWYYDSNSGICKLFYYSGCKGNKNNFATESHCQLECLAKSRALTCPGNAPPLGGDKPIFCSSFVACPEGYRCHGSICCVQPQATNVKFTPGAPSIVPQAPSSRPKAPGSAISTSESIMDQLFIPMSPPSAYSPIARSKRGNFGSAASDGNIQASLGALQRSHNSLSLDVPLPPNWSAYGGQKLIYRDNSETAILPPTVRNLQTRYNGIPDAIRPPTVSRNNRLPNSRLDGRIFGPPTLPGDRTSLNLNSCPDGGDPLRLPGGLVQKCGAGFDGAPLCPKGYYCNIDLEQGVRMCCSLGASPDSLQDPEAQDAKPFSIRARRGGNKGSNSCTGAECQLQGGPFAGGIGGIGGGGPPGFFPPGVGSFPGTGQAGAGSPFGGPSIPNGFRPPSIGGAGVGAVGGPPGFFPPGAPPSGTGGAGSGLFGPPSIGAGFIPPSTGRCGNSGCSGSNGGGGSYGGGSKKKGSCGGGGCQLQGGPFSELGGLASLSAIGGPPAFLPPGVQASGIGPGGGGIGGSGPVFGPPSLTEFQPPSAGGCGSGGCGGGDSGGGSYGGGGKPGKAKCGPGGCQTGIGGSPFFLPPGASGLGTGAAGGGLLGGSPSVGSGGISAGVGGPPGFFPPGGQSVGVGLGGIGGPPGFLPPGGNGGQSAGAGFGSSGIGGAGLFGGPSLPNGFQPPSIGGCGGGGCGGGRGGGGGKSKGGCRGGGCQLQGGPFATGFGGPRAGVGGPPGFLPPGAQSIGSGFGAVQKAPAAQSSTGDVIQANSVDQPPASAPITLESICTQPSAAGRECDAAEKQPRSNLYYYYSTEDRRCKLFFYKGCGGNENRFSSRRECVKMCQGEDPSTPPLLRHRR